MARIVRLISLAACFLVLLGGSALAKAVTPDFAELAKKSKPAVVNISTAKVVKPKTPSRRSPSSPHGRDPFEEFFERFFEHMPQRPYTSRSLGSGFIISDDGYIITNYHVVEGADEIKVKLSDAREFKAEIKGWDDKLDLALLKVDAKDHLPVAKMGNSDTVEVGEWVMAIGNPFGLGQTVTVGIVSAKERVIGSGPYDDFIQTDASINPGNSGGPLLNANGEVIGINTAIVAGGQGIGFAIPVNMAKAIITQLKEKGKVTRGWLGVVVQSITPDLAKSFGLKEESGALVSDVVKDGPAEKAGLKNGDIITEFDGKKIREMNELPRLVAAAPVGRKVKVVIVRNGKRLEKTVVIEMMKESTGGEETAVTKDKLGITVTAITPSLAEQLGIRDTKGVAVTEVKPGSAADEAGIAPGDVVKEVNETAINAVPAFERAVSSLKRGDVVRMLLQRGDATLYVALTID
ncbi:MAG TPA: DegQ family serine endoprotease [Geobacteraceae bacterium]|jgi:serine protease Do|nr:DegQ family serine endoprotease [Geobacteraceae bacterium]